MQASAKQFFDFSICCLQLFQALSVCGGTNGQRVECGLSFQHRLLALVRLLFQGVEIRGPPPVGGGLEFDHIILAADDDQAESQGTNSGHGYDPEQAEDRNLMAPSYNSGWGTIQANPHASK